MKIRVKENHRFNRDKIRRIIREIIEAEDETMKPPKQKSMVPGVKVPLQKPIFPMNFILYKFPDVKKVLTELLTISFRDYIKNIYIVAPKPTTLKVVLKNDQDFKLIYEERSYVVKAKGKRYYLLNIGEKERAIKVIADLLDSQKFITNNKESNDSDNPDTSESSGGGGGGGGGGNFPGGEGGEEGGAEGGKDGEELPPLPPELAKGMGGEDGEAPEGEEPTAEPEPLKEIKLRIKLKK